MTEEQLRKANEINAEIKRIDDFLFYAEKVWTGKIVKQTARYVLKSDSYGYLTEAAYHLDTETKNEMLDVLRKKRDKLKAELESI